MLHNLEEIKFEYEVLGHTPPAIARSHSISETEVEYAIEQGGWKQLGIHNPLGAIELAGDELMSTLDDKIDQVRKMKTAALTPQYVYLETEIIRKARHLLAALKADNPNAVPHLKQITEILNSLRSAAGDNQEVNSGKGGVTVRVMTRSADARGDGRNTTGRQTDTAVEVKTHSSSNLKGM